MVLGGDIVVDLIIFLRTSSNINFNHTTPTAVQVSVFSYLPFEIEICWQTTRSSAAFLVDALRSLDASSVVYITNDCSQMASLFGQSAMPRSACQRALQPKFIKSNPLHAVNTNPPGKNFHHSEFDCSRGPRPQRPTFLPSRSFSAGCLDTPVKPQIFQRRRIQPNGTAGELPYLVAMEFFVTEIKKSTSASFQVGTNLLALGPGRLSSSHTWPDRKLEISQDELQQRWESWLLQL